MKRAHFWCDQNSWQAADGLVETRTWIAIDPPPLRHRSAQLETAIRSPSLPFRLHPLVSYRQTFGKICSHMIWIIERHVSGPSPKNAVRLTPILPTPWFVPVERPVVEVERPSCRRLIRVCC